MRLVTCGYSEDWSSHRLRSRRIYADHPEVQFKPGPFYMGDGWFGWTVNTIAVLWTIFVCIIFCMPNELPVNTQNMNYASVSRRNIRSQE